MRVLWNSCTENSEQYPEQNMYKEFPSHKITLLQFAAYGRTKNSTTDTFLERKVRKIWKIPKNTFAKLSLISNVTGLQSRISDLNKNRLQKKKCFLWLFLQLKIHQEEVCKSFKKVTVIWFLSRIYLFLKNRFHNHGMFRKLLFWKFRKIPRKTTWVEFLWRYSSFPVYQLYL